nr:nipped-B-like protein [Ipomoea batatas]
MPPSSSPLRTASTTDRCAAVLKAEGRPSTTALKAKGRPPTAALKAEGGPPTAALKAEGRPPTFTTDRQRAALHRPPLLCVAVMREEDGKSKGFGFVNFGKAHKKAEREL